MQKIILLSLFLIPSIIKADHKIIEVEVKVRIETKNNEPIQVSLKSKSPKLAKAEGTTQKNIDLKSDFKTVTKWLEENKKIIRDTMKIQVLEELENGKLKVKKETSKGNFIWIMQETIEIKENKYIYKCKLIESIEGGLAYSDTVITIIKKELTNINIKMSAGVNNPEIKPFDVKFDLLVHADKLKNLLIENLNH